MSKFSERVLQQQKEMQAEYNRLKEENKRLLSENTELKLATERAFYVAKKYDRGKYAYILDKVEYILESTEKTTS